VWRPADAGRSSTLSSLTSLSSLVKVTAGESTSTITHSTASNGDNLETVTAEAQGVDITLLNMVNLQISPNTAAVTIDTTTGIVQQPTAQTGLLSISVAGGAPTTIALPDLESVLQTVLGAVGLSGVIDPQLSVVPSSTSLSADQRSGTATSADLGLNLLGGVVSLDIGDATVSASSVAAAVAVTPTPAAAPAAVVPGPSATTVHTGEFWAGSLPIVLLSGMGLAGLMLIARRRLISAARSLTPIARHATSRSAGGLPPGPASGTSSVPPPVSGAGPAAATALHDRPHAPPDRGVPPPGSRGGRAGHVFGGRWRERQMQREPVLRTARDGVAEPRPGRVLPEAVQLDKAASER